MAETDAMSKIVALCKRRGFIFPSSEIYGGVNGCWDYAPLGVELKRNIKEHWWHYTVRTREDVVGLDASIIMHPDVWRASGHVEGFHDLLVDCKGCKQRFRVDHLKTPNCPECGGELTEARAFNLMFKTYLGATEDTQTEVYLRPETAQAIFVDFKDVMTVSRMKPPFGIAQVGKSFRNEVTPRNFIFRSREFEQMELEYFVPPADEDKYFEYWVEQRVNWYKSIGIREENLRLHPYCKEELAHYAKSCSDIEYQFPFGWQELEGIANRGTFDLTQHSKFSGKDLSYFDEETKERYVPVVIEPSAGVDRTLLAVICDAYAEDVIEGEPRVVLRFHPQLAPVKVAVFPLVKKGGLRERATELASQLRKCMNTFYDEKGAIGRRYRRQDEVGTPYCITVDFQTIEDNTVTVRDRDTTEQIRLPQTELARWLAQRCLPQQCCF